jgi:hypothetical protein
MRLITLHDYNNPEHIIAMDPEDFSTAAPYLSGAALRTKNSDAPILIHETPEQILEILEEKNEKN